MIWSTFYFDGFSSYQILFWDSHLPPFSWTHYSFLWTSVRNKEQARSFRETILSRAHLTHQCPFYFLSHQLYILSLVSKEGNLGLLLPLFPHFLFEHNPNPYRQILTEVYPIWLLYATYYNKISHKCLFWLVTWYLNGMNNSIFCASS